MKNLLTLFDLKEDDFLKIINLSRIFKEMREKLQKHVRIIDLCSECGIFIRKKILKKVPFFDENLITKGR